MFYHITIIIFKQSSQCAKFIFYEKENIDKKEDVWPKKKWNQKYYDKNTAREKVAILHHLHTIIPLS